MQMKLLQACARSDDVSQGIRKSDANGRMTVIHDEKEGVMGSQLHCSEREM